MATKLKKNNPLVKNFSEIEDIPTIYANNVEIMTSIYDIRIDLGLVTSLNTETNELFIEKQAKIFMSPQHAKDFLNVMEKQINNYEKNFGKIPPNTTEKLEVVGAIPIPVSDDLN